MYDLEGLPWMECAICAKLGPPSALLKRWGNGWDALCIECKRKWMDLTILGLHTRVDELHDEMPF